MKKIRKLICLVSAILLILQTFQVSAAQDYSFDLKAFGILDGINTERSSEGGVRRDEFAKMTVNLLGYGDVTAAGANVFTDINASEYKNAIMLLRELNLVSGGPGNMFVPDANIKYAEACKILVDALGYSSTVKEKTLESYMFTAASIGLVKGVTSDAGAVTYGGITRMLYNALDIDRMTIVQIGGTAVSYEIQEGNTLRKLLSGILDDSEKYEGIVTADISTFLYSQIPSLRATQLEINGKVMNYNGTAPIGLVGKSVDLYIKTVDGTQTVTYIQANSDNTETAFTSEDVNSANDKRISVEYENGVKINLDVNSETIYIYNNRVDRSMKAKDILSYDGADIRAIDNDDDGICEVVFVTNYSDGIVDRTYAEKNRLYFKDGFAPDDCKYIDFDPEEKYTYSTITDADGNDVDFETIQPDSVISVARSKDGQVRCAVVGKGTISGKIESINDDYVTIDGTDYKYNVNSGEFTLGNVVTASLNFKDEIVRTEYKSDERSYAYVYRCGKTGGSLGSTQAKLLVSAPVSVRTKSEIGDDDGDTTTTRKLFCRNKEVLVYDFASKVRVETESTTGVKSTKTVSGSEAADLLINEVVSYRLDSAGKISYAEVLNPATEKISKTYNSSQLIFGKSSGLAFGIQNDITNSICLPSNDSSLLTDDDLTVYIELLNNTAYTVQGYEYNEDTYMCDLIVVTEQLISGTAGNVNTKSDIGFVTKQKSVMNENDEETISLTMLTKEGEKEYKVSNLISARDSFADIASGDLIAYSLDNFDEINGYILLQSKNNYSDFKRTEQQFDKFCGLVTDIKYNYPSASRNVWVTTIYGALQTNSSESGSFDVLRTNPAPIFLDENKEYSKISADDVQIGDRIFAVTADYNLIAIVVKR